MTQSTHNNIISKVFFSTSLTISIISCANEPYRLDAKDKLMVDTTANRQMEQFAKEVDTKCKQNFDAQVKKLTDSIVEYQIKAIDEKLKIKTEK